MNANATRFWLLFFALSAMVTTRSFAVAPAGEDPDYQIQGEYLGEIVTADGNQQLGMQIVARGEGRFEPRDVKLGQRGDDYTEILDGIAAGEDVVVAANFLIDAESNLKAALAGFTADSGAPRQPKGGEAEPPSSEAAPLHHGVH